MAKTVKAFKAKHYAVDCKKNDSVDIRAGGPSCLGFDFFIDAEKNTKEVKKKIEKILKKHKIPIISITASGERLVEKLWTDKMMEKCIKEHAREYI